MHGEGRTPMESLQPTNDRHDQNAQTFGLCGNWSRVLLYSHFDSIATYFLSFKLNPKLQLSHNIYKGSVASL